MQRRQFFSAVASAIALSSVFQNGSKLPSKDECPRSDIKIQHPKARSDGPDLSSQINACMKAMIPGVLYQNRIRVDYTSGGIKGMRYSKDAIDLAEMAVNKQIVSFFRRMNLGIPCESIEKTDSVLSQPVSNIGGSEVVLGYPFVDDSTALKVMDILSKSKYPIYSPEISWVWSDVPGRIPHPIQCSGRWMDRLGFVEWTFTPSVSIFDIQAVDICQPIEYL